MRFAYKFQFFRICDTKHHNFLTYTIAKYAAKWGLFPTLAFNEEGADITAQEQEMLRHKHIAVVGWEARWYDLFLKYKSEIIDLFAFKPSVVKACEPLLAETTGGSCRLGVHIRRGDYAEWKHGIYCYDDETYADYIRQFAALMPDQKVCVCLSTNDPALSAKDYRKLLGNDDQIEVHLLGGNAVEDLYMLSECDYVIGPPSTYSLVAAMYRDIPLCRMDQVKDGQLSLSDFKLFDYWFRRIV